MTAAAPPDPLPLPAGPVVLRRLRPEDLPRFQAYRGDAELGRYQGWQPMSDDAAAAFIAEVATAPLFARGQWCQIAIAAADDDRLLGDIGLHLSDDGEAVEIGFTLARDAQGRGLATAAVRAVVAMAFAQTTAQRVVGITDARNSASKRLLERIGLQHVSTHEAVFRGEACIEHVHQAERRDPAGRRAG